MFARLAITLTCFAAAAAPVPARAAHDVRRFPEPIERRWSQWMDSTHAPGLAVVVVRDSGAVAMATLGIREVERRLPVTSDSRFYLASCTKTFVASAVASLAHDGRLGLDDPVSRHLPGFRLADPGATDSLTLRDLLAHRRGLHHPAISLGTAHTGQMTEERFVRLLARVRPGSGFEYSNLHYLVAGRVLAALEQRPWPVVLRERVLRPLGMDRAALTAHELYDDPDVALPYRWDAGAFVPATRKTDRTLHSAGGMGASIGDLARWLRAHLGGGRLDGRQALPADVVAKLREPSVVVADRHPLRTDQLRIGWGAGWEMRTIAGDTMYVHTGSFAGAAAHMSIVPSRGVGVAVLSNANLPPLTEAVAAEAYDWALGRTSPDLSARLAAWARRMAGPSGADTLRGRLTHPARDYAGRYANADWGDVDVRARGGALQMAMGDLPMPLALTGDDRFVADGDTPGTFEWNTRGRVAALRLVMAEDDTVRFERR